MVALVDGVPRTLNLAQALARLRRATRSTSSPGARSSASTRPADREHILEGRIKALDVIDEIIALIRASDDAAAAKAGLMAEPFEFSEVPGRRHPRHAAAPAHPAVAHRPRDRARRRPRRGSSELEAILADDELLRSVIKDELLADQGGVRHAAGVPDHARRRRDVDRGPRRRQGARRRDDRGAVRQGRAGRLVQDPGAAAAAASAAPS